MKLSTHLSTPWWWKAELALLADLQRTVYPYKWLPTAAGLVQTSEHLLVKWPTFTSTTKPATQPTNDISDQAKSSKLYTINLLHIYQSLSTAKHLHGHWTAIGPMLSFISHQHQTCVNYFVIYCKNKIHTYSGQNNTVRWHLRTIRQNNENITEKVV